MFSKPVQSLIQREVVVDKKRQLLIKYGKKNLTIEMNKKFQDSLHLLQCISSAQS